MERIGFAGLGTMGRAMAANLARAGFPLRVWNRTPGRAGTLIELGASESPTPQALAEDSEIVVICVSDTPDVEAVLFDQHGVADGARTGALVIDCSTVSPAASRGFAARLAEQDVRFVDAPVSGGSEGAVNATLTIMVGGEADSVTRARPVLEAMGRSVTHMGAVGSGQATKAVNQVMLAGTYLGVAEGLVLAIKAGLDPARVVEALGGGAARSWVLENRSGRMISDDYPLGFRLALHLKDLRIALDLAATAGAELPVARISREIEERLVAEGHGDEDMSALARDIRRRAGL